MGSIGDAWRQAAPHLRDIDIEKLKAWNSTLPNARQECVHETIDEHSAARPNAEAVCSWDGSFTYGELVDITDRLAVSLMEQGVKAEVVVPLLFHKTRWMPVAMIGVMKAGGAFVLLDPSHPLDRLQTICNRVSCRLVLASEKYMALGARLCGNTILVSDQIGPLLQPSLRRSLPKVEPHRLLYVVFTSGSTGEPKGVLIEHMSYTSGARVHVPALHMDHSSRVFQFASSAFDAIITDILSTLIAGGCVCIPSEDQRTDRCIQAIDHFRATHAFITPSFARSLIHQGESQCLRVLVLIGEAVQDIDIAQWGHKVCLINGYGPAECSAASTVQNNLCSKSSPSNIGRAVGGVLWLVSPEDVEELVPVGSVGELLVEGPTVGRGYLNDPEKTAAAFINAPEWLQTIRGSGGGRTVYRTGDLVRYDDDGSLLYVGRVDAQIKLRGQRIELGEVEAHIRKQLTDPSEVLVDAIQLPGRSTSLVAFIVFGENYTQRCADTLLCPATAEFRKRTDLVEEGLRQTLPSFMVPALFVPIKYVPLSRSGKTDRRQLREIILQQPEILDPYRSFGGRRVLSTERECVLQQIWSTVLRLRASDIGANDHFFRCGGDSIAGMSVVALARTAGWELTLSSMLEAPHLSSMALLMQPNSNGSEVSLAPFSLLGPKQERDEIVRAAIEQCQINRPNVVEDLYPCTPLQEGLFALGGHRDGSYIGQWTYNFTADISTDRLRWAWDQVAQNHHILRTRIIKAPSQKMYQVVLKESICWQESLGQLVSNKPGLTVDFGKPLVRFDVYRTDSTASCQFILTMHHALYDGWSLQLILGQVEAAYRGDVVRPAPPFGLFVDFTLAPRDDRGFWESEFAGFELEPFPKPDISKRPSPSANTKLLLASAQFPTGQFTRSIIARLAWAMVQSQYQGRTDVAFGVTVSGRSTPLARVEMMTGPTIATVPWRSKLEVSKSVTQNLESLQKRIAKSIPHEQAGLQNMKNWGPGLNAGCAFQTLLIIQHNENGGGLPLLGTKEESGDWSAFATYALTLFCNLNTDPIELEAWFDSELLPEAQVQCILQQFSHMIQQLSKDTNAKLRDVMTVSNTHVQTMLNWNSIHLARPGCLHELFAQRKQENPDRVAVEAWDGTLTYQTLDDLSTSLATYLRYEGVGRGSFVPICSEKSRWVVVSILAVIKAGAAFILLDPSHPKSRLQSISRRADCHLAISSRSALPIVACIVEKVIISSGSYQKWCESIGGSGHSDLTPAILPSDNLFVVFTSGSTGTPKGALATHASYLSYANPIIHKLGLNVESRWLQFASYAFDMSANEMLWTIISGGCLCILSETQRMHTFTESAAALRPTHTFLTPSFARTLQPNLLPSLQALMMAGEAPNAIDSQMWSHRLHLMNAYGPAECGITHVKYHIRPNEAPNNVGHPTGGAAWLVHQQDVDSLVPLGAVGEVILEGPTVGPGYLNEPEKTAAAFIPAPRWHQALQRPHHRMYRTGDLMRYEVDGSFVYMGRKDSQLKVRGQRVDPGDVESHIQECFEGCASAVVDLIPNATGSSDLGFVAFILLDSRYREIDCQTTSSPCELFAVPSSRFSSLAARANDGLRDTLPQFMIPSLFIPLASIPRTMSGKVDRQTLRKELTALSKEEMKRFRTQTASKRTQLTEMELRVQQLWSSVLGMTAKEIGADDSFLELGGDSISAMAMSSKARAEGLELTVADTLRHPRLSALAMRCRMLKDSVRHDEVKFSLVDATTKAYVAQCVREKGILPADARIVDILPATEGQTTLLKEWSPIHYCYFINGAVDTSGLRAACSAVMESHSVLRTAFIDCGSTVGVMQVVADNLELPFQEISTSSDTGEFCDTMWQSDCAISSTLGQLPTRFSLISRSRSEHVFAIRLSHAQYDGVSLPVLLRDIASAYSTGAKPSRTDFSSYVYFCLTQDRTAAFEFWRTHLQGSSIFQLQPSSGGQQHSKTICRSRITAVEEIPMPSPPSGTTLATVVLAAVAAVLGRLQGESDFVLGRTVHGRSTELQGIDRVLGPCLNFIPFRVKLQEGWTSRDLIQHVHDQTTSTLPYDYVGMSDIVSNATSWPVGTKLGCVVQHQNVNQSTDIMLGDQACTSSTMANFVPVSDIFILSTPQDNSTMQLMVCALEHVAERSTVTTLLKDLVETIARFSQSLNSVL